MNTIYIADQGNSQIAISWQRGNSPPKYYPPIPFNDPLNAKDHGELRWYLEEYLQFPYGAESYRAQKVEENMAKWGEALFKQAFPTGNTGANPGIFYQEAVREGLRGCEFCVSSDNPDFLNIPWELIYDPTPGRGYLAPSLGGLYRQRSGQSVEATRDDLSPAPNQPFRILLVIARPEGAGYIPIGSVARPLLEALRPFRPKISLEVLRPPTLDALQKRLNDQPGRYQLVHFDGHGVFAKATGSLPQYGIAGDSGHLVFENLDGTPKYVSSQDIGQLLADCRVPLFVLNACQSAEEGKSDPFSSVASQLIAVGAKGVIAMAYSVYVSAASKFVQRFYEALVQNKSLSQAVADGRRRLYAEPEHESVAGSISLKDWIVPTLYQQELQFVPLKLGWGTDIVDDNTDRPVQLRAAEERCPEGRFGFIGRDYDILRIERALRDSNSPWIILNGIGGTGKTDLAYGFARWYSETGGCDGGVFVTSFKEKADFGQVIGSIVGYGTDFSRLPETEQWDRLVNYLHQNPCLIVWDNFETVNGYPDGAVPLARDYEREKLAKFLKALKGGKSRVIITTRKPGEPWLGVNYSLVSIKGLITRDAADLARAMLKTVERKPEDFRDDPNYASLIELLRGHPRSMEVVLTQLRLKNPSEIIEALQNRIGSDEDIMDASFEYVFDRLSERTKRHLPFIGLFATRIFVPNLALFVSYGDEQQAIYQEVMGESLDKSGWREVLLEAASAGLLRSLGEDLFEIHPTLPSFLRRKLSSRAGKEGFDRLDEEFAKFYASFGAHFDEELSKAEKSAVSIMIAEEPNTLRALRLAERKENWVHVQSLVQALNEFYEIGGREDEWRAIRSSLLSRLGRDSPDGVNRGEANLWMFLLNNEANDALQLNDLDNAEIYIRQIADYLKTLADPSVEPKISVAYHQLGIIAEERQKFDEAEQWYRKALEVRERLGLERYAASDYHQLGRIAQERQKFDEAEQCYRKALEIYERLGLERDAADEYHQLGIIAQERQKFDEAEQWYRKALEIYERLGLERYAASDYHQLGRIAEERQKFDEAEQWYRKALEIYERLGLERYAAGDYHQLGRIAEKRQKLDEAEQWYRKALEIYERLGLERDAADEYHQLGMIAQERQKLDEAEQWYRKALEIYQHIGHPPLMVNAMAQMGVLKIIQSQFKDAIGLLGYALAITIEYKMQVSQRILKTLGNVLRQMGDKEFCTAWQQAFSEEPPSNLIKILQDTARNTNES
jgi:tetratricopeptide (TPR) repeat protein